MGLFNAAWQNHKNVPYCKIIIYIPPTKENNNNNNNNTR